MATLLVGILLGLIIAIVLSVYPSWKRKHKRNKAKKLYEKLYKGVPKRVKNVSSRYELRQYSDKPILIDGELYIRKYFDGGLWHVNEEYEHLIKVGSETDESYSLHLCECYLSKVVSLYCRKKGEGGKYIRCSCFAVVLEVY